MIKPAAEGGGQPIRGRGVALERGVAGTGPASGGVRGEALPSEALQAPLGRTASLGPTAFFSVREVGGRGGRGRRVLGVLGVGPGSLRGVGRGGCSEPVCRCCLSHFTRVRERNRDRHPIVVIQTKFTHSPTASEHHPRPKVTILLGTAPLTPSRRLTGRWRAPARPSKLQ